MSSWRQTPAIAVGVIALFVAVQVAVPISRLGTNETTPRFAWQMFSTSSPAPQFVVTTDIGDTEVDLNDFMARTRGDVDIVTLLPPHLCAVVPGAELVTWADGEHQC